MHFFNPVPLMKLVEIIRAMQTSDATFEAAKTLAGRLGKTAVAVADSPGFVVNRDAGADDQRGGLRVLRGARERGGDRPRDEARAEPPHRPARARRSDRTRRVPACHGRDVSRILRFEVPGPVPCSGRWSMPAVSAERHGAASTSMDSVRPKTLAPCFRRRRTAPGIRDRLTSLREKLCLSPAIATRPRTCTTGTSACAAIGWRRSGRSWRAACVW